MDRHQWHGPESQAASDFVEGRLKDHLGFEEHLENCTRCRLDVEALRRMGGRTRTWEEEEPYQKKRTYRPLFSGLALSLPILLVLGGLFLVPQRQQPEPARSRPLSQAHGQSHWETTGSPQTIRMRGQCLILGPHSQLDLVKDSSLHLIAGQLRLQQNGGKFSITTEQVVIQSIKTDFEVFHLKGLSRVHLNSGQATVCQLSDGRRFRLTLQQPEWPYVMLHPNRPAQPGKKKGPPGVRLRTDPPAWRRATRAK
jgi:hypothetical protein